MKIAPFLAASLLALPLLAQAQAVPETEHAAHHAPAAASAPVPNADGEVRKIDPALGKITLRHGPIANLDMPAMTMVFRVAEPSLLEGLKVGDKVQFAAMDANGVLTVTAIKVLR